MANRMSLPSSIAHPSQFDGHPTYNSGHANSISRYSIHVSQTNGEKHPPKEKLNRHQQECQEETIAVLPLNDPLATTCMPESWARASMLIRLNSLAGGASGVRVDIAESLVSLLNKDIVPRILVRGSISASGDLSALA